MNTLFNLHFAVPFTQTDSQLLLGNKPINGSPEIFCFSAGLKHLAINGQSYAACPVFPDLPLRHRYDFAKLTETKSFLTGRLLKQGYTAPVSLITSPGTSLIAGVRLTQVRVEASSIRSYDTLWLGNQCLPLHFDGQMTFGSNLQRRFTLSFYTSFVEEFGLKLSCLNNAFYLGTPITPASPDLYRPNQPIHAAKQFANALDSLDLSNSGHTVRLIDTSRDSIPSPHFLPLPPPRTPVLS